MSRCSCPTNDKTIGFLSLVQFKDRGTGGGLICPTADVLKILKVCEIVFTHK